MLAIALTSGLEPWGAAIAGAFLPADIAQDVSAARLFADRINPYGPVIREAQARLVGLPLEATFPHFPHPPFSLIVGLPFAFMSFPAAALLWFTVTVALVFALAVLLDGAGPARGEPVKSIAPVYLFVLLLAWPPVLYNLEKGQWSVLLAVLIACAWRALMRGQLRTGAMWAAAAAAVKVFPVVMGVYFLIRSVRATAWFAATGLALTAIPLLWIGFGAFGDFVRESRSNMPYWESFPLVMLSIHGAIARLLVGGKWAHPLVYAPAAATAIEVMVLLALVGLAVWITWKATRNDVDHALAFCAWVVLLPMLNPQSLGHNGVLLALPLVVLARMLVRGGATWHGWGWAVGLTLVSLPKQTVWRYAAPPVGPLEGVAISALPTWGGLVLFAVTVGLARRESARSLRLRGPFSSGKIEPLPSHH